jgi:hypothetical protein
MGSAKMLGVMDITVLIAQIQLWKIHRVRLAVVSIHYGRPPFVEFADSIVPAGGLAGAQVTYNSTSKLWACCTYNGGQPDCSEPTDEVFPAPGPSSLKTIIYLPTTGSATYSTPSATATSVSNTNTSSTSLSSSSDISPGAAAGIGVGVGAGIILAAAAIAFVISKRRRLSKINKLNPADSEPSQQPIVAELVNERIIPELDNGRTLHELANSKAGS